MSIHEHGFTVIPRLVPPELLHVFKDEVLNHVQEVTTQLDSQGVQLGIGSAAGFHEVCLRSEGRLDVPCRLDTLPAKVLEAIAGVAEKALDRGDGVQSACTGLCVVRGQPGCPPQIWHSDSTHLKPEHEGPSVLNIILALTDVTVDEGPTHVLPGSHKLTNHLRPEAKFDGSIVYQNQENGPELIGSEAVPVVAPMPAGSVLIFDDRALHRGGGNTTSKNRDVVCLSWKREDFKFSEYYEATRSLWSYGHRSLASTIRHEFPGLVNRPNNADVPDPVFADGASGSQLHETVIAAMVEQLKYGTANIGGPYESSERAGKAVVSTRHAMADFLNCNDDEIVFGPSMTALTYHAARAFRNKGLVGPGSNVVVDPLSHGANVWTWVQLAKASGAEVRWLPVAPTSGSSGGSECILDVSQVALSNVIDSSTAIVAAGAASNGVGSVHDVSTLCAHAQELSLGNAVTYIDAVHYAPHAMVDVATIGCDMLACSPYKFFGPHSGVLFGRSELLASLPVDRLDVQDDRLPCEDNCYMSHWELGTQNYEALAGVTAAVNYISGLGERFGGADVAASRRDKLRYAWTAIAAHERELKVRFLEGAAQVRGLKILGVTDPSRADLRTATFAVAKKDIPPLELAERLSKRGVWCTASNHYAGFWSDLSAGMATSDVGMARIGFLHYNTLTEIDTVLEVLDAV